jgi:hypothetical protein
LCHGDYRGKIIPLVNKQIRAQISFTGARQNDHNLFSFVFSPLGHFHGSPNRGSGGYTAQNTILCSQLSGGLKGLFVGHCNNFVYNFSV